MGFRIRKMSVGLVPLALALSACSSSSSNTTTVSKQCCENAGIDVDRLAVDLKPSCATDQGNVRLQLSQSKVSITFACRDVRQDPEAIRRHAVAAVGQRNNAAKRAAKVIAYEQRLGVSGELVHGQLQYPDDLDHTTWGIGTAQGPYAYCGTVSDVKFRARQLQHAAEGSRETPVHWLKIEAARIAGACPDQLAVFYDTVRQAGANEAVDVVAPLLAELM